MQSALFRVPVLQAVKYTAYSHFCAGENIAEASTTLKNMWKLGLRGIMDYGLEDATDSQSCDKNLTDFVNVVHQSAVLPSGSVGFPFSHTLLIL
jgi:proline dehydrogenase